MLYLKKEILWNFGTTHPNTENIQLYEDFDLKTRNFSADISEQLKEFVHCNGVNYFFI